jgi:hypothetical protein
VTVDFGGVSATSCAAVAAAAGVAAITTGTGIGGTAGADVAAAAGAGSGVFRGLLFGEALFLDFFPVAAFFAMARTPSKSSPTLGRQRRGCQSEIA